MTPIDDPRVDAYIDALPAWQQASCREVRELVHAADPDVTETIKRSKQPYFVLQGNICACSRRRTTSISHTSSDGRTLAERLGADAAGWSWPSESIAAGAADPAAVIALWLDEPPDGWHRRNLLDPEQRVVGVGFCANPDDPSGNRLYWIMIVTRPAL